jgi:hypothetical protein
MIETCLAVFGDITLVDANRSDPRDVKAIDPDKAATSSNLRTCGDRNKWSKRLIGRVFLESPQTHDTR